MKRSIAMLAAIVALALTACATAPPAAATAAQAVYATHGTYTAALTAAVAYKNLPPCTAPTRAPLCADAKVVSQLQQADDVAYQALTAAQQAVRTPGFAEDRMRTAVTVAEQAAQLFLQVAVRAKGGAP